MHINDDYKLKILKFKLLLATKFKFLCKMLHLISKKLIHIVFVLILRMQYFKDIGLRMIVHLFHSSSFYVSTNQYGGSFNGKCD